jgi:hypothetical protein
VIRDRVSLPVRYTQLPPGVDLSAALAQERERLIADGWCAEELTRHAFCFCDRGDERVCVSIDCYEPGHVPISHGSGGGQGAAGK